MPNSTTSTNTDEHGRDEQRTEFLDEQIRQDHDWALAHLLRDLHTAEAMRTRSADVLLAIDGVVLPGFHPWSVAGLGQRIRSCNVSSSGVGPEPGLRVTMTTHIHGESLEDGQHRRGGHVALRYFLDAVGGPMVLPKRGEDADEQDDRDATANSLHFATTIIPTSSMPLQPGFQTLGPDEVVTRRLLESWNATASAADLAAADLPDLPPLLGSGAARLVEFACVAGAITHHTILNPSSGYTHSAIAALFPGDNGTHSGESIIWAVEDALLKARYVLRDDWGALFNHLHRDGDGRSDRPGSVVFSLLVPRLLEDGDELGAEKENPAYRDLAADLRAVWALGRTEGRLVASPEGMEEASEEEDDDPKKAQQHGKETQTETETKTQTETEPFPQMETQAETGASSTILGKRKRRGARTQDEITAELSELHKMQWAGWNAQADKYPKND